MKNKVIQLTILLLCGHAFISSCSKPASKKHPNILFAISDDQSFPHTGFAGATWIETPAFDRVASEGVYFTNCYAGSPGCAPSRGSIVTGRYHWQNEQAGQHAAGWLAKYVPFVDLLDAGGYHTGATGKGVGPFRYGDPSLRKDDAAGKMYNEIKYEEGTENDERFAKGIRNLDYFANFKQFLSKREAGKPFFFWYGASEPHRVYEKDSWKRRGKRLEDAVVPAFLPDAEEVRGDLLDYAVEIEWFDLHLSKMIAYLEEIGELENTIIIVTADNGMSFPRAKANGYEYGAHVPMAIRYPARFPGGRKIENPVSFVDLAPTILELTGISPEGMLPISGESLVNTLESKKGAAAGIRDYALYGRERHSSSRYRNYGYPVRAIRKGPYLYLWNMKPDRWPAGAPQRIKPASEGGGLYPMYGIDSEGTHHSDWAFTDIDAAPSKSFIVEQHAHEAYGKYFEWSVGKRPEYELYDVVKDPSCLTNLAGQEGHRETEAGLRESLLTSLKATGDPRVTGADPEVFDSYPRYGGIREFPE